MSKVLIVDDELSIRDTLSEFVRQEGHEALTADTADTALEVLSDGSPDVVVTDIILPRVTGVELLRRIHETAPDIQVIMITGEPTAETAAEAVRLGAFDYLSKPILRDGFKSAVASALRVTELARRKRQLEEENLRYRNHLEKEVERKTEALRASEEKYRYVIENANEAVFVAQGDRLRFINPKTEEMTGYSQAQILSMPLSDLIHPEDRAMVIERHTRRLAGEDTIDHYEFRILTAAGEVRWIEIRPVRIEWEGQPATLNFATDVTERKHIEAALRGSEARFRQLFEVSPFAMLYVNREEEIVLCNDSFVRMHGASRGVDAQIGRSISEFVPEDMLTSARENMKRTLTQKRSPGLREYMLSREDGTSFPAEVDSVPILDDKGRPIGLVSIAIDITERKRAEEGERERQEQIRRASEALLQLATQGMLAESGLEPAIRRIDEVACGVLGLAQTGVWLIDESADVMRCVDLYYAEPGEHRRGRDYPRSSIASYLEALDSRRVLCVSDVHNDPRTAEFDLETLAAEGVVSIMNASIRVGGRSVGDVTFEHTGSKREWTHEDEEFAWGIASLVTLTLESVQRREAERALERREREYHTLFEDSPVALWLEDYSEVRALLSELEDAGVTDLEAHLDAHPEIVGRAVRAIRILDVNDAAVSLLQGQSKEDLLQGLEPIVTEAARASIGKQLLAIWDGETFFEDTTIDRTLTDERRHVAVRWSVPPGCEKTLERVLVATTDVTATVEAEQALRDALTGTIEAIGLTTETRDPYTAGHQRRVTELAVAIAEELGLDQDAIDGTRAAGLLHDIGKMAIPAEILSKPSRLTEMEMALMRSHPEIAYDILRSISFPWPLAEIVLQHHERIDGTGYPEGLSGEEIRIEARTLAVADTVEAMASHRPYRAALGIDLALEEIEEHQGTRYDADVASACLRLFREGRFTFEDPARAS